MAYQDMIPCSTGIFCYILPDINTFVQTYGNSMTCDYNQLIAYINKLLNNKLTQYEWANLVNLYNDYSNDHYRITQTYPNPKTLRFYGSTNKVGIDNRFLDIDCITDYGPC